MNCHDFNQTQLLRHQDDDIETYTLKSIAYYMIKQSEKKAEPQKKKKRKEKRKRIRPRSPVAAHDAK